MIEGLWVHVSRSVAPASQVVSQTFKFVFLLLGFVACGPPGSKRR